MNKRLVLRFFLLIFTLILYSQPSQSLDRLRGVNADLTQTSVSGLSSGAFMATQLHVAFSDVFQKGAGIIAGGPYFCVGSYEKNPYNYLYQATSTCMAPLSESVAPDGPGLFAKAKQLSDENRIANVANLKDDRIYIFSGSNDRTVTTLVVDQVEKFYRSAGIPQSRIKYDKSTSAGHAIIVEKALTPCPESVSPFINDCDFEQSFRILQHIYKKLNPPSPREALNGKIIPFDQSEFFSSKLTSMSREGYLYIPKECEKGGCRVHVSIHGCRQGASFIGNQYYSQTGYNEVADTNRLIILYPQVNASHAAPFNPKGCWDFWGYSSMDPSKPVFYLRESPQMTAIIKMIERLGESN